MLMSHGSASSTLRLEQWFKGATKKSGDGYHPSPGVSRGEELHWASINRPFAHIGGRAPRDRRSPMDSTGLRTMPPPFLPRSSLRRC